MPRRLAFALAALAAILAATPRAQAVSFANGGFGSGDFTGWSLDTDGTPGGTANFSVENVGGDLKGRIDTDFQGDATIIANTLYQGLDLTAAADSDIRLSFDWEFFGSAATSATDEWFVVGLGDGSGSYFDQTGGLGLLVDAVAPGSGTFSALLDRAMFANVAGWTLEFQLLRGFDGEGSVARGERRMR